jgi:predicted phosphodiesterase
MKFLLLSDVHLSDRPPSSCTESYTDDLFDLLDQALTVAAVKGCTAMVLAGDTFHQKAPSRVSHRLVHRMCTFIEVCTLQSGPSVLILAGNHDIANDRLESVWQTQPLGMLYRAGARELNGWDEDLPIYGVPWLQGYGNYREQCAEGDCPDIVNNVNQALAEYRRQVFEAGTGSEYPLVVAHAPLYPEGKELTYEYFPAEAWAEAMGGSRGRHRVFYGHVHEPHGVYGWYGADPEHGDYDVKFCNNGALSRGSLHEYNLTRQVGVTIYDTQTAEFEFVPLNAKPADQVFRLQEKQQATDLQGRLDDFLAGVGGTSLEVMSTESVIAHIRSLDIPREVADLAAELIEEAQHAKGK